MEKIRVEWEELAELAVTKGINLQKNQVVHIDAPAETVWFVRMLTKKSFENGAKDVIVNWTDHEVGRERYLHAAEDAKWVSEGESLERLAYAKEGAGLISVRSPRFGLFDGVEDARAGAIRSAEANAYREVSALRMSAVCTWTVVMLPNEEWAKLVYPSLSTEEAMEKLTDAILKCSRVEKGRTIENWKQHRENCEKYANRLTDWNFEYLKYKNNRGTELRVGLAKGHKWCGGGVYSTKNLPFIPNIPTEEIATVPDWRKTEGTVVSTMPLIYAGGLIEGIHLKFEAGKVVEFSADKGQELLESLLNTDDGAKRLGEAAIVPVSCPITKCETLFYNTIFDENASCHLALGNGYPMCLKNGDGITGEELTELGVNHESALHVDFMIGSDDLDITGITYEGKEIPVLRNGEWVIGE